MAALAAGLFLDAGQARAQTAQAETMPYIYLWGAPGTSGWGPVLQNHASQVVRWWVDPEDPEGIADFIVSVADTQVTNGHTDDDNVSILLQNFGVWMWAEKPLTGDWVPSNAMLTFVEEADGVNVEWVDPDPQNKPQDWRLLRSLQPWAVAGRANVKAWMQQFVDRYDLLIGWAGAPVPHRFHFDSEVYFGLFGDANATRVLEAIAKDPRWHTVRVPGSKDYMVPSATDKTMQEMWMEACDRFQWGTASDPYPKLEDKIKRDENTDSDDNRKYFLWYGEICKRAVDGAMQECAYELIKDRWPSCKVSNYEHMNADGKPATFGWFTGRENTGGPIVGAPPPQVPQRKSVNGWVHFYKASTEHYWSDFVERDPSTNPPQEIRRSVWDVGPGRTKADFSSPVLYTPHNDQLIGRKNYYLPPTGPNGQNLNLRDAVMQNSRRNIEAILNTPGQDPSKIVPWVGAIGTPFFPWNAHQWTPEEMRDMLAMLRSKKVYEIIMWWNDQSGYPIPNWGVLRENLEWIYKPQLNLIRVASGTWLNPPPAPVPLNPPYDRLRYTLAVPGNHIEETVDVGSVSVGGVQQVVMTFRFGNLVGLGSHPVSLNLECGVNLGGEGPISEIRGFVYVWHPGINGAPGQWVLHTINDFGGGDPSFGFFAPINDAQPNIGYYETRRWFEQIPSSVNSAGDMDIKVVLQRTLTNHPFTAKFDLVQLVGAPAVNGASEGMAQGADFNHSQTTESYDAAAFMAAYAAGAESADFNNDGVVNGDDLTAFNAAFVAGPP